MYRDPHREKNKKIGKWLRDSRLKADRSAEETSREVLGTGDKAALQSYEDGAKAIPPEKIPELAAFFGVTGVEFVNFLKSLRTETRK